MDGMERKRKLFGMVFRMREINSYMCDDDDGKEKEITRSMRNNPEHINSK